ncbi:MAG TPA: SDR family NAD(P)-dependent oxidoreductase [Micromonosporaceae bacterium]
MGERNEPARQKPSKGCRRDRVRVGDRPGRRGGAGRIRVRRRDHLLDTSWRDWRTVLAVDLNGPFLCAQRAARRMVAARRGGRIINVTSVHETATRVGAAAYCAAKAGLGMLTRVMAQEFGEYGITVNAVAPGEIATPMTGREDIDPTNTGPECPWGGPATPARSRR